ncbi:OmpH family outer membrane protein [Bacterioplanoides pacificum]|uniref:OmpH family outer membrane protein n=1 Tax=Bacterioplanoides pacificum TaxID=1171596 RepID=A0ABV7VW04_9GAMM
MAAALLMNAAVAEGTKVAVVDMERALFLSEAAKTSIKQFEKDNKDSISKLKSLEQQLRDLQEKVQKNADVMSDDERRNSANDFEEKKTEFQFFAKKLQQMEQKWKREFFQTQLPELEKLLKAIIDEAGYDVVLQSGAAIYVSPKADITKLLIERLNAK